jgi:hypothetical protein
LLTFQALTHVFYDLAAHPENITPLREEIEPLVTEDGWSKASVAKMSKLDSFIKESLPFQAGAGKYTLTILFLK